MLAGRKARYRMQGMPECGIPSVRAELLSGPGRKSGGRAAVRLPRQPLVVSWTTTSTRAGLRRPERAEPEGRSDVRH